MDINGASAIVTGGASGIGAATARRLARALERHGVPHVYDEFDGTHSDIDHRLDVSLPRLYAAITGTPAGREG